MSDDESSLETDHGSRQNHSPVAGNNSNEESMVEVDDFEEWPIPNEREQADLSTDESQKYEACEPGTNKSEKKPEKPCKPKVKIKTLTIDGQLVYFCKICDKIFTRRKDKLNHELAHSGESVLTCTECGKEYLHESSLASHMRTHDGDPLYMCDLCPKMFAQSHHLKTHILSHSEPTNFTCKTCYKEFPTAVDLGHHNRLQIKLEMTNYWCKMCKVYFCRNHHLNCEKRLHAYCCSACNEFFYTHKKLKIHMKKFAHFSEEKPKYIEPLQEHELYPDKIPENLKKLQAAKENDLMKNIAKTNQTGKRQRDENAAEKRPAKKFKLLSRKVFWEENHSSTSVQDSASEIKVEASTDLKSPSKNRKGKPYCKKCNKSFKDTVDLERHKVVTHGEKQESFQCDVCSMGFSTKDELERHGFKHSGERMHTCPMCGEEFPHSLQLTKHLRTHIGDFPYKCSQCGKAFRLKIQLIQHVRLHIAQDANSCEKCPAKFSTRTELQDHIIQIHGEADSYQCHLCNKSFSFRYKLQNHLRLHTNVKCFQCYICHKTFATKHYLQRHLQIHIKQGMDVDIQNIIVGEDSKSELESIKEHITKKNSQHFDTSHKRPDLDSFEDVKSKKSFPGIRRSISNIEMGFKSQASLSMDSYGADTKLRNICDSDIKVEIEDNSDSASEHSFCSSFTRDSERSDQFRFSSDESYSFKTAMAKERRRLRRKWKNSRHLITQSDPQTVKEHAKPEVQDDVLVEGKIDDEDEKDEDVMDMMIELNGVRSENDGVTVVYVDLTQMKAKNLAKNVKLDSTEASMTHVKKQVPLSQASDLAERTKAITDGANKPDGDEIIAEVKSETKGGVQQENTEVDKTAKLHTQEVKALLFEIDAEQLLNGNLEILKDLDSKINNCVNTYKSTDEKAVLQMEEDSNTGSFKSQKDNTKTSSMDILSKSEKNDSDPGTSNLDRLTAVFEKSSKYLPLSSSSSLTTVASASQQLSVSQGDGCPSIQEDPNLNQLNSTKLEINHLQPGAQQASVPASSSKTISVLPALNQQEISGNLKESIVQLKTESASHSVQADHKKPSYGKTAEGSSVSQFTVPHKIKDIRNNREILSAPNSHVDEISGRSSHVRRTSNLNHVEPLPPITLVSTSSSSRHSTSHIYTSPSISQSLDPKTFSSFSPSSGQPGSGRSSLHSLPIMPSIPGSGSQGSSVFSNSGSEMYQMNAPRFPRFTSGSVHSNFPSIESSLSLQASVMSMAEYSRNNMGFPSNGTCLPFPPSNISNTALPNNPLTNTNSGMRQPNEVTSTNLQIAAQPGSFPLNPSSIFDTNNPVYRDMNMLDLVSPTHAGSSVSLQPQMNTGNVLPGASSHVQAHIDLLQQQNAEAQLRQNLLTVVGAQNLAQPLPQQHLLPAGNSGGFMNYSMNQPPLPGSSNFMNHPVNQGLMPSNLAVNSGQIDSTILSLGFTGGDLLHARNVCDSLPRDNSSGIVAPIPQPSINVGPIAGLQPSNSTSNFPINAGAIGDLGPFSSSNIGMAVSMNSSFLCGPGLSMGGLPSFNSPALGCGLPMNAPINPPHIMNNMGAALAPFASTGLQDNLRGMMAPAGVSLLNPVMAPQTGPPLRTNSLAFINNVNPGFFTNF